ncbi:MAG TPA: hypothetical protein PL143_08330, partial [Rhodocyclaceae bacterium]|nr:hypothetical protein [Rhodocyclaceae bacterium]
SEPGALQRFHFGSTCQSAQKPYFVNGSSAKLESERRIGAAWKLELEARTFAGTRRGDPSLHGLRNDGFVTLRIARHF